MILICFAGFLRFDELCSLKFNDGVVEKEFLILIIIKSKTDQYRQENEVLISKGVSVACPYNMYLSYIKIAGLEYGSDKFLFRPVLGLKIPVNLFTKIRS